MIVIDNENIRPFDVDGTLIVENTKDFVGRTVEVWDTITKKHLTFRVNEPMVRLLLEEHHRGNYVLVWSRGGKEWATEVIKALQLDSKVHLVMTKPIVYFDDLPVENWLKDRVFIDAKVNYKK